VETDDIKVSLTLGRYEIMDFPSRFLLELFCDSLDFSRRTIVAKREQGREMSPHMDRREEEEKRKETDLRSA